METILAQIYEHVHEAIERKEIEREPPRGEDYSRSGDVSGDIPLVFTLEQFNEMVSHLRTTPSASHVQYGTKEWK